MARGWYRGAGSGVRPLSRAKPNYGLGRLKVGKRNKTEALYETYLKALKRAGDILWYRFEGIKLRLADNTFYTPDFAVMRQGGQIELHEVKGFWRDDARVKIKVAADLYPFVFIAIKKNKNNWDVEVIR